jgi:Tfp pilus assembly protein PilF
MDRHHCCRLLPLLLGLLVPLGCARCRSCLQNYSCTTCASCSAEAADSGLPPRQAALLCLATARALEKDGNRAEAIAQYEKARTHDPQLKSVAQRLAILYDLQGDTQLAGAEYQRALHESPHDAELLNNFGYFHLRNGDLSMAEHWLRQAIMEDPSKPRPWVNLGETLARQGQFEESYNAFTRVLRPAEAHCNLGVVFARLGRVAEAQQAFQLALSLDPSLRQAQEFLNALSRGPATIPTSFTLIDAPVPPVGRPRQSPLVTITDCQAN